MNFDAFKREFAEHYAALAQNPAVIEHARVMVREFAREYPQEFGDLPQLVADALKAKEAKPHA